jgi:hypothetical protein
MQGNQASVGWSDNHIPDWWSMHGADALERLSDTEMREFVHPMYRDCISFPFYRE